MDRSLSSCKRAQGASPIEIRKHFLRIASCLLRTMAVVGMAASSFGTSNTGYSFSAAIGTSVRLSASTGEIQPCAVALQRCASRHDSVFSLPSGSGYGNPRVTQCSARMYADVMPVWQRDLIVAKFSGRLKQLKLECGISGI
jgi:hypothetical protein